MKFTPHTLLLLKPPHRHRTLCESAASIKWVRDRALDHAVEKERNLKPMLNLKNFLKSQPSKSLPLSLITQNKQPLQIPIRPTDFIRKYPSIFQEFLPAQIGVDPHVTLTPQVLDLDEEELLVYRTETHKQEVADRLLKLLMIGKVNRIPLNIVDMFKWDLGLPHDYVNSIVPEFPDYFCVSKSNDLSFLELVCWSRELAVSEMEKKVGDGYSKGMPIEFKLEYSRGFEVDKKFKKWVDDWQKMPYVSPYENVFQSKSSEESDKWAVGVLHEVLSLLIPKKTEKDNILCLGEYMGVRSKFKKALLHHPGIFYVSSKLHTHTVVLREGYKRDLLIGNPNPVMVMRSKYIHLMNMVKEENKSKSDQGSSDRRKKKRQDLKEGDEEGLVNEESGEDEDGNVNHVSDSEFEEESDDDYDDEDEDEDDEDEDEDEDESTMSRGRTNRKPKFEEKTRSFRHESDQSGRRYPSRTQDKQSPRYSREKESPLRNERSPSDRRSRDKESPMRNERSPSDRRYPDRSPNKHSFSRGTERPSRNERNERNTSGRKESGTFSRGKESFSRNESNRSSRVFHDRTLDKESPTFFRGKERPSTNEANQSGRRYPSKTMKEDSPTNSRRKEMPARQNVRGRPNGRFDDSRDRGTTNSNRKSRTY